MSRQVRRAANPAMPGHAYSQHPPWGSPPSPDGATHEVLSLVTEPRRPLDEPPPVFGQYDAAGRAIKDCVSKLTLQIGNALGYR